MLKRNTKLKKTAYKYQNIRKHKSDINEKLFAYNNKFLTILLCMERKGKKNFSH